MSIADEIRKLDALRQEGMLTDEEYQQAKKSLLDPKGSVFGPIADFSKQENNWAAFIHLSQFLGYLVPGLGLAVPVILWQMKKDSPLIDQHGRVVMNWMISHIIWLIACFLLSLVLVGIPMFYVLFALMVVFPIIGALRAYEGKVWSYPLCIRFFKETHLA